MRGVNLALTKWHTLDFLTFLFMKSMMILIERLKRMIAFGIEHNIKSHSFLCRFGVELWSYTSLYTKEDLRCCDRCM